MPVKLMMLGCAGAGSLVLLSAATAAEGNAAAMEACGRVLCFFSCSLSSLWRFELGLFLPPLQPPPCRSAQGSVGRKLLMAVEQLAWTAPWGLFFG